MSCSVTKATAAMRADNVNLADKMRYIVPDEATQHLSEAAFSFRRI